MSEIVCPVHELFEKTFDEHKAENREDIARIEKKSDSALNAVADFKEALNTGLRNLLVKIVIMFGATIIGLVVFIVLNTRIPTP